MPLILGPILFADFEIPDEMPFGGEQMLVVKKLVGGDRVVDAMGRDDEDKSWSGHFRGPFAEARARELDLLRIQGQELVLTWASFQFLVVVKAFRARYSQPLEIPYSISCVVLQDLSNPALAPSASPDDAINSDVNDAGLLAGDIGLAAITAAVANVSASVALVPSFAGAPAAQTSGVQTSLNAALSSVSAQATIQNGVVAPSGSVAGVVGGMAPQAIAASLTAQSAAFGQLGQLYQLQALLGRASINLQNAGS